MVAQQLSVQANSTGLWSKPVTVLHRLAALLLCVPVSDHLNSSSDLHDYLFHLETHQLMLEMLLGGSRTSLEGDDLAGELVLCLTGDAIDPEPVLKHLPRQLATIQGPQVTCMAVAST
jgi:hypothetical protein